MHDNRLCPFHVAITLCVNERLSFLSSLCIVPMRHTRATLEDSLVCENIRVQVCESIPDLKKSEVVLWNQASCIWGRGGMLRLFVTESKSVEQVAGH